MHVSELIKSLPASPIRKLTPLAEEAKARGIHVIHLNIGQPDIETPTVFFDAVQEACRTMKTVAYMNSAGYLPLREAMAAYYETIGAAYTPDEIFVTQGGSEALQFAVLATCDPGTEILVPEPYYSNYTSFTIPYRVKIKVIPTSVDDDFALPGEAEIENLITDKTKAILLSNPGNPTGVVYSREELDMLVKIALKHDLFVIADELYRVFTYDDLEPTSFLSYPELKDHLIFVDSVSKRYSACGIRIGSIASHNGDVNSHVLRACQGRLSAASLEMIGAEALYRLPDSYFTPIRERYRERRNVLIDNLSAIEGISCSRPRGAFYAMVRLPVQCAEDFARWLLSDFEQNGKTLMVTPAPSFYDTPGRGIDEVRVAYVRDLPDLLDAASIMKEALFRYPGRTIG
jgi:aspartate aminotransferase